MHATKKRVQQLLFFFQISNAKKMRYYFLLSPFAAFFMCWFEVHQLPCKPSWQRVPRPTRPRTSERQTNQVLMISNSLIERHHLHRQIGRRELNLFMKTTVYFHIIWMQKIFSRVHATLWPALSVGPSVRRSVGNTLLFCVFLGRLELFWVIFLLFLGIIGCF